jgi:peptide/nickel transport system substrate-binding protein
VMLAYTDSLEAYRSDRFTNFTIQPAEKGDLLATWGPFSFISITPVGNATGGNRASSGVPAGVWIAVVAAIVIAAGVFFAARRRRMDEDRA